MVDPQLLWHSWMAALLLMQVTVPVSETDQRGLFRNGACDLGAYEFNGLTEDPNPDGDLINAFNMITPNGDGINDTWQVNNLDLGRKLSASGN